METLLKWGIEHNKPQDEQQKIYIGRLLQALQP
jgi:hypothetical protein